jgi:hypothetical protein
LSTQVNGAFFIGPRNYSLLLFVITLLQVIWRFFSKLNAYLIETPHNFPRSSIVGLHEGGTTVIRRFIEFALVAH